MLVQDKPSVLRTAQEAEATGKPGRRDERWEAAAGAQMRKLFRAARKLRPDDVVYETAGKDDQWLWAINGHDRVMPLDRPYRGPASDVPVDHILGLYVFIFYNDLLVGFLSEHRAGFGIDGSPSLRSCIADCQEMLTRTLGPTEYSDLVGLVAGVS